MIDTTKIMSQIEISKQWKVSRAYISQLVSLGKLNTVVIAGRSFVVIDQKFENLKK